jgi:hypothetical protein
MSGLPWLTLAYDTCLPAGRIHGFAFWKFAKPAHEHHLQVLLFRASLILFHLPGLKKQRHLTV